MPKTKQRRNDRSKPAKKPTPQPDAKKLSGLDAAARVLDEASEPLSVSQIVGTALAAGYWQTGGKTPAATIYSAMLREIRDKGAESRFKKVARGRFALSR